MKRQLFLISNSTNAGEAYLGWCKEQIANFLKERSVTKVLFIPYAGVSMTYDAYAQKVADVFIKFGVEVQSIHTFANPIQAVKEAHCVVVGGGNTFHLVHEMHRLKLMEVVRERALNGMPYMGWSAGSNLACPTLKTTNDMPIIEPESFNGLNLIPFQINPHYLDTHVAGHGGETREDRINEFLMVNKKIYVAGLREACTLFVKKGKIEHLGERSMRVFHHGMETKEYTSSDNLNFLLDIL